MTKDASRHGELDLMPATSRGAYAFRTDHGGLVVDVRSHWRTGPVERCEAVVLLNHNHPDRVHAGARLAADLAVPLVVLCSQTAKLWRCPADEVARVVRGEERRPSGTTIVSLPWPAPMPLEGLATPHEVGARSPKYRDVAAKRNIALSLVRCLGWRRVLFLDDDVYGLDASHVDYACTVLGDLPDLAVVSWMLADYPDNSVVCHARRLARWDQGIFVGSGAMLLDVSATLSLFPPVYNEDWLFLFDLLRRGDVGLVGDVRQLPFDPYAFPERAREEEFGDLLAEGLFHLLHEGADVAEATHESFWDNVLRDRRRMLERLRTALRTAERAGPGDQGGLPGSIHDHALASLATASMEHARPDLVKALASFVGAWRADMGVWRRWFGSLVAHGDVRRVMVEMGLPGNRVTEL